MKNILISIIILINCLMFANTGSITGVVIDHDTQQPLIGANVIIDNQNLGAACDESGKFRINNILPGSYTITTTMIGYTPLSKTNINVYSNRQTPIKIQLDAAVIIGEKVLVKSKYFEKAKDGIVSTQTIDREAIRSDPVGVYDVQMMVHSLPSVVTGTDQNNEIIVRGGGPGENLFVVDNLEIPNPNHFGEVGTGGGPVNIINTEFVERVDFFAGGFPAKYGDKQSSVMNMHLREGNYNNHEIDWEMSMAGLGFLIEGPIINKKASYMSSYRKSFVKYIIKSAGLSSVPEYSNTQHKITYNINSKKQIIANFIGAIDAVDIVDENRPDLKGAENVNYSGYQYTGGITYKSLFSKNGYFLFSLGKTSSSWDASVYSTKFGIIDTFFVRNNIESDSFAKWDFVYKVRDDLEISAGFNTKLGSYNMKEYLDPDTLFIYDYPNLNEDQINELNNFSNYHELIQQKPEYLELMQEFTKIDQYTVYPGFINDNEGDLWKNALYSQLKYKWNSLILTAGIRYDNVRYNKTATFSPRFGMSFILSPITKINFAAGLFYQTPSYWMFMNPFNSKKLKHSYTEQIVAGIEHLFADDIKLTIESYHKLYHNRPILISAITEDSFDNRLGFTDAGEGYSTGIELFLQKKFSSNWHGTLSYSLSDSKAKDFREYKNRYYPWDFDSRHGLTVVNGYKFKFDQQEWYKDLRKSKYFSILAWIPFFPSDQLEISFRYRYSDGLPYTPKVYNFRHRKWYEEAGEELNSVRYSDYSRLDIMFLRKFNFKKINLITFLDLQNIFNTDNEWERVYLDDGTYEMSYQYKQIPVGGIIIEF